MYYGGEDKEWKSDMIDSFKIYIVMWAVGILLMIGIFRLAGFLTRTVGDPTPIVRRVLEGG